MSKIRVYELARELQVESKALLLIMKELGIDLPGHQSVVTTQQIDKVNSYYKNAGAKTDKSVVVKRRKKADQPEVGSAAEEADEIQHTKVDASPSKVDFQNEVDDSVHTHIQEPAGTSLSEIPSETEEEDVQLAEITESKPHISEVVLSISDKKIDESSEEHASKVESSEEHAGKDNRPLSGLSSAKSLPNVPKKSFVGATIVRKASPEEIAARQTSEREQYAARQSSYNSQRSPSSSRPHSPGSGTTTYSSSRNSASGGPSSPSAGLRGGPGPGRYPNQGAKTAETPAFGGPPPEAFEGAGQKDRGGFASKSKDRRSASTREEEERALKSAAMLKGKKPAFQVRDVLARIKDIDSEDGILDIEIEEVAPVRRSVYTPGGGPRNKREAKRRKDLKTTNITMPRAAYRVVIMEQPTIIVAELARQMSIKAVDIIKKYMAQGLMLTLNHSVDFDTAVLIASDFGFEVKSEIKTMEDVYAQQFKEGTRAESSSRPPIVTVMGHVDHGKTSILDAIRAADVVSGEAGGITQHIGAYTVQRNDHKIAFLDTPGHAAFSTMRARGAKLTDIVVLVVAADDGVMPQTVEAIAHAKQAKVPVIVAINKIDKKVTNLDRVYNELAELGLQSEAWGGDTQFVKVSALQKIGIDDLLDAILLQAEMMDLKAIDGGPAKGVVVEAHLDKGRGPVTTLMVTEGCLKIGDHIAVGTMAGRVRGMQDHHGAKVLKAGPSTPVEVTGLSGVPMAGDQVFSSDDEKVIDQIIELKSTELRIAKISSSAATLDELLGKVASAELPQVPVIIKGDVQGSVEAIVEAINKLESKKVKTTVVHKGVGGINESDINLAETSGAVLFGFNARAPKGLAEEAEKRGVVIKYFSIIYELMDAVKSLMAGKLPPVTKEVVQGHAEVRNAISVPKVGMVAGSAVLDGKITRSSHLRLIRNDVVVFTGRVSSLRRFKDDVKEVQSGYECGVSLDGCNDVRVGDVLESFMIEESQAVLDI